MIFTYKLVFGLTDPTFLHCAMMPEVGDTLTNFFFPAAVQLQGTTALLIGSHGLGITCQRTVLIFSSLALFKRSLNSNVLVRHCKIYYF